VASNSCRIDVNHAANICDTQDAPELASLFELGMPHVFSITCSTEPQKIVSWPSVNYHPSKTTGPQRVFSLFGWSLEGYCQADCGKDC